MATTKNTKAVLVFIKKEYIRNAEAYLDAKLPTDEDQIYMDTMLEHNWLETEPHGLVAAYKDITIEAAKKRIENLYPGTDSRIFIFLPVSMNKDDLQQLL